MSGQLFLFEGGEGSGKTTVIQGVAATLREQGQTVVTTREPGGTVFAEEVRDLLIKKRDDEAQYPSPRAQLLAFYAARFDHIAKVIVPALEEGSTVLCDRFELSSFVYQVYAQDAALLALFKQLHAEVVHLLCTYNPRYLICDVAPEIGIKRARERADQNTRFDEESLAFHERVREGMRAGEENMDPCFSFSHLDASQSKEDVLAAALDIITNAKQ